MMICGRLFSERTGNRLPDLILELGRGRTGNDGGGTCPLLALEDWLKIARIENGFVIRSVGQYGSVGKGMHPDSIGKRVKDLVRRARIANPKEYGGHSLRAGFVTEASANGATNDQIMKQTGHTNEAMVRRYARGDQQDKQ